MNNIWAKPNDLFAILRCTNKKYAKRLVKLGSIKFNTPKSWVEEEKEKGKGRGDILEGVFAACNMLDVEGIISYSQQYNDVYGEIIDGLTYFRRKRTMDLPCYCFFLLRQGLFELPSQEGVQKLSAEISGRYFRDFADNLKEEEIADLEEDKKPAIVLIHDIDEFIHRVIQKLISMGVKQSEIMLELIEYENKKVPFYCTANSPKELKLKDNSFSYQEEGRIIVNTDNHKIKEYLNNNPIQIGPLNDIAQMEEVYLYEGAIVEMTADVYKLQE
ncbi:MAG: hypothetical protein GX962_02575 [Epulopiscium sp.]|nr:hypothetical protein [Candidatus Epulonipiscium sp.]